MQSVIDHLKSQGFLVDSFLPNGKIHRFKINDSDKKNSGWYLGYQNYTRKGDCFWLVVYNYWGSGEDNKTFCTLNKLNKEDKEHVEKQIKEASEQNRKEREEKQLQAKQEVEEKWETLSGNGASTYLQDKSVGAYGIRFDEQAFYVPVRDEDGNLWSLQKIQWDGAKYFHSGGRVQGCFHQIGEGEEVYLCEGYATGATIFEATSKCVVIAFNANNLIPVAKILYSKGKKVTVCGDDDTEKERNVGREKAEEAGKKTGSRVVFPNFTTGRGTDWNDLRRTESLEAVQRQLGICGQLQEILLDPQFIVEAEYPDENIKTGKRAGTIENVQELLRRLKVVTRYNVISKEEEMLIPDSSYSLDNRQIATLAEVTSWCNRCRLPTGDLAGIITKICDSQIYNPVVTWIESEAWDGQSRLEDFYATIESTNEPLKEKLIKAWMLSAVAAAYEPNGVSAHGVLVLKGKQYLGKTAWFKKLAQSELLADGMFLRPDDKDSVYQALSHWLVELGELDATFRKSDISQLKAFITKDRDILRRPYARKENEYARRTVFFGSVNETDFLKDPTGNRRFWTVDCKSIDYDHKINMQQVWAEYRELYRMGAKWVLSIDDVLELNTHNQQFEEVEPMEERVISEFDWKDKFNQRWLKASQVCQEMGIEHPTRRETNPVAKILRKITSKDEQKILDGNKLYLVPRHIPRN